MMDKNRFLLALSMIPSVGSITAKKLIDHAGSAEAVFNLEKRELLGIPGIGRILAERVSEKGILEKALAEEEYCRKKGIRIIGIWDEDYPGRLKECADAPLILFYRGRDVLKGKRIVSIVGTRRATSYGSVLTEKLIQDLSDYYPETVIVSGLAYGIDYLAHSVALSSGLNTVAVLGHGLQTIYPAEHRGAAMKILEQGGLVTDFHHWEKPERNNFIKRNRIIAGLADATIVVESGMTGGALITADIAFSYNREVFAFPGKVGQARSEGCNDLIKRNKAGLIEGLRDFEYFMGWQRENQQSPFRQRMLFLEFTDEQKVILKALEEGETLNPDSISLCTGIPVGRVSAELFDLELKGVLKGLPGNHYRLL